VVRFANTGRWSLCIIPSSLIPAPTLHAVDFLHREERQQEQIPEEGTYHPRLFPPKIKSILVHSVVSIGDHPVKVAKFPDTPNLGVSARVSKNLKSGNTSPRGLYFTANFLSTFTGDSFPVTIWYAPESVPVEELLKSPVRMTGPLDIAASNLPRIRRRDAPYLR
jgi:hypothetical protein